MQRLSKSPEFVWFIVETMSQFFQGGREPISVKSYVHCWNVWRNPLQGNAYFYQKKIIINNDLVPISKTLSAIWFGLVFNSRFMNTDPDRGKKVLKDFLD